MGSAAGEVGVVEILAPGVRRVVAPNGGPMTGAGTNTYLIGERELLVLDPGPDNAGHRAAILAAAGDVPIRKILVTHTHCDHSPSALPLAQETGASLIGAPMANDGHQDATFQCDICLSDGTSIEIDGLALRAIATPGHVANHFCFLLERQGILFTGDHIMQGSTVVIIPPSGDMHAYMHSLRKLQTLGLEALAPGHGNLIPTPHETIDALIQHRLGRERKVREQLALHGPVSLKGLTPHVYDDVDARLHPVAQYSLWAHLLKLEKEGIARKQVRDHWLFGDEVWSLLEE
ncbi:MBL fold metallo-hydrolase [Biformimicrobium ophioploci]|uniref:MBL fold metallo-hydrolase n=1 Tax=Biformimicrobium ophioploci TaxID=3036711 RepID=A0ABQ6LYS4_9GAMM|nr:MBL fold metallo-hydrolase [Microbulbifer sp. NKW57]GMG87211.1 MBL fold metallo-hydrolase [Microbulbifer sp. NKW57]